MTNFFGCLDARLIIWPLLSFTHYDNKLILLMLFSLLPLGVAFSKILYRNPARETRLCPVLALLSMMATRYRLNEYRDLSGPLFQFDEIPVVPGGSARNKKQTKRNFIVGSSRLSSPFAVTATDFSNVRCS